MKNEECIYAFILYYSIHLVIILLFRFTVFIDEANKAINSLQSFAILSNSSCEMYSVSRRILSQFIVSFASFNEICSFEAKSEEL